MDGVLTTLVNDQVTPGGVSQKLEQELCSFLKLDAGFAMVSHQAALSFLQTVAGRPGVVVTDPLDAGCFGFFVLQMDYDVRYVDLREDNPGFDMTTFPQITGENSWIYVKNHLGLIPETSSYRTFGALVVEDITSTLGSFRDLELSGSSADVILIRLDTSGWLNGAGGCFIGFRSRKLGTLAKEKAGILPSDLFLTDMNAALALVQWNDRERILGAKKELLSHFALRLQRSSGRLPKQDGDCELVLPFLPVVLTSGTKEVLQYAQKKGVESQMAFSEREVLCDLSAYPGARNLYLRTVHFPLFPSMSTKEAEDVGRVLATLP